MTIATTLQFQYADEIRARRIANPTAQAAEAAFHAWHCLNVSRRLASLGEIQRATAWLNHAREWHQLHAQGVVYWQATAADIDALNEVVIYGTE